MSRVSCLFVVVPSPARALLSPGGGWKTSFGWTWLQNMSAHSAGHNLIDIYRFEQTYSSPELSAIHLSPRFALASVDAGPWSISLRRKLLWLSSRSAPAFGSLCSGHPWWQRSYFRFLSFFARRLSPPHESSTRVQSPAGKRWESWARGRPHRVQMACQHVGKTGNASTSAAHCMNPNSSPVRARLDAVLKKKTGCGWGEKRQPNEAAASGDESPFSRRPHPVLVFCCLISLFVLVVVVVVVVFSHGRLSLAYKHESASASERSYWYSIADSAD